MKYYKITNREEIHLGMRYKIGLNVDILPFNPSGDCQNGGIYFSREDILAFINKGYWIREVRLPEDEPIYENPGFPKKWKAHRVILGKRRKITAKVIKKLIKEGADVHASDSNVLVWACIRGDLGLVKYLVKLGVTINTYEDRAISCALIKGNIDIVTYLEKIIDKRR